MTKTLFDKVTIIGFGLIRSSLARNIRAHKLAHTLICGDVSEDVCRKALDLGLADIAMNDLAASVAGSDLVILAMPVGAVGSVMKQISGALAEGAILTDVGSVKQTVIDAVQPHMPAHAFFVPAHPIAGTEHSGPESGFVELFQKRWCILTPAQDTPLRAIEKITALWESCGAMIEIMEARHHDLVLAITSHLPHLIAYSIVDTAATIEDDTKAEVIKYSASGFRDFTRIAASNPIMWRDIFLNNKDAVLEILQRFNEDLTALQKAIRTGDGKLLEDVFTRTRAIRRAIIDAKQA